MNNIDKLIQKIQERIIFLDERINDELYQSREARAQYEISRSNYCIALSNLVIHSSKDYNID